MIPRWLNPVLTGVCLIVIAVASIDRADAQPSDSVEKGRSTTGYRFSYTPLYQFETDIDAGGQFDVQRHFLRFDVARFIDRHWMVGVGLSLDYERWNFSDIAGFSGVDLWDEIFRPGISIPIF